MEVDNKGICMQDSHLDVQNWRLCEAGTNLSYFWIRAFFPLGFVLKKIEKEDPSTGSRKKD